ncbi:unnamed protein product [Malus baccata var. baccata]
MYAVGKLVMVLNVEKVFDEIANRQSEDNAGNPFDRMTHLFHIMVVCSQFCIIEGEFWNVWDPGGRLAKILGVMLCSKHQENHCEKSFIDAGKADELSLPSRDDKKSCTNVCFSKRSFGMDAACVTEPILLSIKDQLHEVDLLDFTAGRSEEEALKVMHEFSSALDGYVLRYLDFSDNALDENGVNAFGSLLSSQNNLEELYLMNMARLNMCHNTREWHRDVIRKIKWLYEKGVSIMIDTQGQGHYEDFSDYIKTSDDLTFKLLLYFQAVNSKGFGFTKFGSTEEAKTVVGNMNDVAASAMKIKEMEQGLTSLIVLGNGRLSDLIAQLQDILGGVNEADILPGKFDSAVIRAQIQQLAQEFWVLTSSGPITIYNESSSSSGNYASYLVPVVALAAMGYRFHDFIFTILVSDAGFVKIDSLALRAFDERSHSGDCDFQLGYHMPISDTGGTLRGLLTSNVQTKDAHKSKFLICTGKFMKNGTIVHLKLGFHEFILDKGGTTIQRLLNSKSIGKVEIILVQENASAQLFDALQPLEEVDLLIVLADQTRIAPNVFDEISDSSYCVVVQCAMCYCKGIRDKGGGSKFWYTVISNMHFSCLNESGNCIECSQDGMIGVVMLVAYTTCIDVGGVFCSTYITLSRAGILEGGKDIYTTTFISGLLTGRRMMTMTDLGILKHFLSEYVEQRKLGAAFTVAKHIPKLGDLSLLVENTSAEQLGLVKKVTIFTDSDGLQVHGGSPFDITGRNHFLK